MVMENHQSIADFASYNLDWVQGFCSHVWCWNHAKATKFVWGTWKKLNCRIGYVSHWIFTAKCGSLFNMFDPRHIAWCVFEEVKWDTPQDKHGSMVQLDQGIDFAWAVHGCDLNRPVFFLHKWAIVNSPSHGLLTWMKPRIEPRLNSYFIFL